MKRMSIPLFQIGVLFITLCILLLCVFWLPEEAAYFAREAPEYAYLRYPLLIGIYVTIVPFMYAIVEGLRLSRRVALNDAFSIQSVNHLKHIKISAFLITLLYFIGLIILMQLVEMNPGITLLGILIILASMMIGLIAGILEELLRKALEIKEENDLTV
jgi:D-alanyl-lipoteichoic acid acyltransferase DltB (MBOAT superfamily)